MLLVHIKRIIHFHIKTAITLLQIQIRRRNPHFNGSIGSGIVSHILLTLFKNHMNIDHTFLANLHSLPGNFYVIDGRFCKILHDFLIAQIMTSVPEIILSALMLAAGLGRLAGILLVVRGIQDILNASRYHYGILPAVITTVLGAVLIALPMTTSRVVISLCGLLVLIVGVAILVDRLKNRRPKEPSESDIIDAL